MEYKEQQPRTRVELEAEIEYRTTAVAEMRDGRKAMLEVGMAVEPEDEDMDMHEHLAALSDAEREFSMLQAEENTARILDAAQAPLPRIL